MFNFQTGEFCPVAWQASGGALVTLNIRSHNLELSVLLLDVTTTGSGGVRSRIASLFDVSGTVETVFDLDIPPYAPAPAILPGYKGVALFFIAPNAAIQVPLSVEKLHFQSAVDKEVVYSWDGKCNSLAGAVVYPAY